MKRKGKDKITIYVILFFFGFAGLAAWIENVGIQPYDAKPLADRVAYSVEKSFSYSMFPILGYAGEEMWNEKENFASSLLADAFPLVAYLQERNRMERVCEDADTVSQLEGANENTYVAELDFYGDMLNENKHAVMFVEDTDFFSGGSGFISEVSTSWVTEFEKADVKMVDYGEEKLADYEFAIENFYTVDSCTAAVPSVFSMEKFLEFDASIDKSQPGPHILIYHTHSQEAFADSVPGDKSTTIVGAGAKLADLLREEYGYEVYHHTGEYDVNSRDDAYANAEPALEEILARYPQIQVIIDLHRDGVDESRHLVAEWQGKKVAQFMFFNGLSYLNTRGDIDYLPNPNLQGNLATSYQAAIIANEYYPGLARRNYLNGYRYNMHYREKTLLIELGAQTNTVDEIMSACDPLAHILDMVFSGEE